MKKDDHRSGFFYKPLHLRHCATCIIDNDHFPLAKVNDIKLPVKTILPANHQKHIRVTLTAPNRRSDLVQISMQKSAKKKIAVLSEKREGINR